MYNIALQYLDKDIKVDDKTMFALQSSLRYDVSGGNCPSKIFGADDISIQRVSMDTFERKNGLLLLLCRHLQQIATSKESCRTRGNREYLITDMVNVKAYVDAEGCCVGSPDYKKCKSGCSTARLRNAHGKPFSKEVLLTGSMYRVSDPSSRRRRLLQRQLAGC